MFLLQVENASDAVCGSDIKTDAAAEKIPPEVWYAIRFFK